MSDLSLPGAVISNDDISSQVSSRTITESTSTLEATPDISPATTCDSLNEKSPGHYMKPTDRFLTVIHDYIDISKNRGLQDALIISTVCCVLVLSVFLTGATSVAITSIGAELEFKQTDLQWPLNVFPLSYGCLLLFCGRLADIFGSKRMFLLGSSWFALWSVAAAFAKTAPSFILFLGLLGVGSAANTPAGISIISTHFPPGKAKNRAFSILGAGGPIGYIIGMILGGVLSFEASWRAIFWLQAGLSCLLVVFGWLCLPPDNTSMRYNKGLDWIGALLSTTGIGLLVCDLAESTSAPEGWGTPFVPSLFGTALVLLVLFVLWEVRREAKNESVLLPMSIWIQPGVKMGPIILLVFFAWWGFNTLSYFVALFFQEIQMLNPLQTAIRLVPMGISGVMSNIVTGYLVAVIPGQILVVLGLLFALAACLIFSLIKVTIIYWAMGFIVVVTLPVLDIAYTVANMQVCSGLPPDSQALAGSIFSVATRLGTSFGLAVTSAIASSVSARYNKGFPQYEANDPTVLMVGFRAAGWTCCGTIVFALIIAVVGMRGLGLVGQDQDIGLHTKRDVNDIEAIAGFGESTASGSSSNDSIATLTNHVENGNGKDAKSVYI